MTGIAVGTSGLSYDDWAGVFYPRGLPRSRWLEHYAGRYSTVEINYSFYRLPSEGTIASWRRRAPEGFLFTLKGSRFITHVRRLHQCAEEARRFVERAAPLGPALATVLWQLPRMPADAERLERFVAELPAGVRHAVEFRDRSWLVEEVFDVLRRHRVAHVHVSSAAMPRDLTVTTDFVYVRFHGFGASYAHDYTAGELAPWVEFLRDVHRRGLGGFAYFNNDARARAPKNASELIGLLGDAAVPWGGDELTLPLADEATG
jgi:uncharacterized protein YecE (DUF72 family)